MVYPRKALLACFSAFILSSQSILSASDLSLFNVGLEECQDFPSDFSLAPEEIYYSLKYATYKDTFQILEFGAGEGTVRLVELLQKQNIPYEYNTFENCLNFILNLPNVTFHYYPLPDVEWHHLDQWRPFVQSVEMPDLPIADLVIVDGPHGRSRADWYTKFKHLTRPGTIILIDDFHHYEEFGDELDKNFVYETIIEYNRTGIGASVNDGLESVDGIVHKCFKIVRVLGTK
jgi:hypothetical protein